MPEMVSIVEAKKVGIIPVSHHDVFEDNCPVCGSEINISENRTIVECSNLWCKIKVALRMRRMFENLDVKQAGPQTCRDIVHAYDLKSHVSVFKIAHEANMRGYLHDETCSGLAVALTKPMRFKEVISKLSLPSLAQYSYKLFDGIDSLSHFIACVEKVGSFEDYVHIVLNKDIDSKLVQTLTDTIYNFREDIQEAGRLFNIVPEFSEELHVAVTGEVLKEGAMTRTQFLDHVNSIGEGHIGVRFSKAFGSVKFVIADYPSGSKTYLAGKARNILISSDEFCNFIREEVTTWKKKNPKKEEKVLAIS